MIGTVTHLFEKPLHRAPMVGVTASELVLHHGLTGSRPYSSQTRKITILSLEDWQEIECELEQSIPIDTRRANIVVQGLGGDLREYIGQCLQLLQPRGGAIFIVGETDPCQRMEEAVPGLHKALAACGRGGIYGLPIRPGPIMIGDRFLPASPSLFPDLVQRKRADGTYDVVWQPSDSVLLP